MRLEISRLAAVCLFAFAAAYVPRAQADPAGPGGSAGRVHPALIAVWEAPPVDVPRLLAEDDARRDRKDLPWRVGFPMPVAIEPASHGTWTDEIDGSRTWRLELRSTGARWLVLGFDRFELQAGGSLSVFDARGRLVSGPHGAERRRSHGQLWLPPIAGDTLRVELTWPMALGTEAPALRLGTVSHGYRPWNVEDEADGGLRSLAAMLDESGSCNVDVACPAGAGWETHARAVVRMLSGGFAFCTGALINNTAADCAPYVLTAEHCSPNPPSTTVQFNYQRTGCGSGTIETSHVLTGSTLVAADTATDMLLLLMDDPIPPSFGAHFAGWNRSTGPASRATGIHHPEGDPKKISHSDDALFTSPVGQGTHWRIDGWEIGTTEPGSSGSPLFDQNGLCVGQLTGGLAACGNTLYDDYGKLARAWDGAGTPTTRLKDWLDPLGGAPVALLGLDAAVCELPHPALRVAGWRIDDAAGNGNGIVDPGETVDVYPSLANFGTGGATRVAADMTTATAHVQVVVPTADWPNVGAGQAAEPLTALRVSVERSIPCGNTIALDLAIAADEPPGEWLGRVELPVGERIGDSTELTDDVESGTALWTTQSLVGSNPWRVTAGRSQSPSKSWFVPDVSSVSDSVLRLQAIPDLPAGARLSFAHWMASEAGYDGGVLEYSVEGGPWLDAGEWIPTHGYNLRISSDWGSPLGGRLAWSGALTTWRTVEVDLSALAGSSVALRWRFATDSFTGADGWYVDDVRITAPVFECARRDPADLDGNGSPDILWRNANGGAVGAWEMNGTTLAGWLTLPTEPSPAWQIQGLGDFDGDGDGDVLWRNANTGQVGAWVLQHGAVTGWAGLPTEPPASGWQIQGVGDFTGDGTSDVLWRNTATGEVGAWLVSGGAVSGWAWMPTEPPDSGWSIQGVGDFTGDGSPEVLWRHAGSGSVGAWVMSGTSVTGWAALAAEHPASGWQIRAVLDLTGDGGPEIVWRNAGTGEVGAWLMDGTSLAGWTWLPTESPSSGWEIRAPR